MTRMLTNDELGQMFIGDTYELSEDTPTQLERIGMTIKQAASLWEILAEAMGADPAHVGVAFMAGVLVSHQHGVLEAIEHPFYENGEA